MGTARTVHPYTVAILADIHGNVAALRAVLDDLASHPYQRLVVAGDLVLGGPQPAATIDVLRALDATVVYGNSDRRLLNQLASPDAAWGRAAVGPARLAWVAALPFECRITPPGGTSPVDDLLVVHATPTSASAVLVVEPDAFGLLTVTPEERACQLLGDARAGLIVGGHLHYGSTGTVAGRRFATVGSVGCPWDGDRRAAYALATWSKEASGGWRLHHCRVAYDYRAVIEDLQRTDAPFAGESARRIDAACLRPDLVR